MPGEDGGRLLPVYKPIIFEFPEREPVDLGILSISDKPCPCRWEWSGKFKSINEALFVKRNYTIPKFGQTWVYQPWISGGEHEYYLGQPCMSVQWTAITCWEACMNHRSGIWTPTGKRNEHSVEATAEGEVIQLPGGAVACSASAEARDKLRKAGCGGAGQPPSGPGGFAP